MATRPRDDIMLYGTQDPKDSNWTDQFNPKSPPKDGYPIKIGLNWMENLEN